MSCYHSWRIDITYLLHTSLCRGRTQFASTDDWWVDRRRTEPHSLLIQSTWSEEISITTHVYTVLSCSCHLKTEFTHNSSAEWDDNRYKTSIKSRLAIKFKFPILKYLNVALFFKLFKVLMWQFHYLSSNSKVLYCILLVSLIVSKKI